MAQSGIHGLVGMGLARLLGRRVPAEAVNTFSAALIFGSMIPDVDMYPASVAFLMKRSDLLYAIHRTATHSAWVIALAVLAALVCRFSRPTKQWLFWGLAIGFGGHVLLDVFLWFAPLDFLWPFHDLTIRLWPDSEKLPALAVSLRDAMEIGFFALFLRVAARMYPSAPGLRKAKTIETIGWVAAAILVVGSFFVKKATPIQVGAYVFYLLLFAPVCWSLPIRWREHWVSKQKGA